MKTRLYWNTLYGGEIMVASFISVYLWTALIILVLELVKNPVVACLFAFCLGSIYGYYSEKLARKF